MSLRFDDDGNEETPLLHVQSDETPRNPTPLPTAQIAVLVFPWVAESIVEHSISPYLNQVRWSLSRPSRDEPALKLHSACSRPPNRGRRWAESGVLHGNYSTLISYPHLPQVGMQPARAAIIIGLSPLCRGGCGRTLLEPSFRPHWSQASHFIVPHGHHHFHHIVWPLPFFLGSRPQVAPPPLAHTLEGAASLSRSFQPVPAWCAER